MSELVQVLVRVPKEQAEEFSRLYPMYGAWSWFIRQALSNFLELHEEGPNDLVSIAISETFPRIGLGAEEEK